MLQLTYRKSASFPMNEVQRIKEAYSKRKNKNRGKYSHFFSRQRESEIKEAIRKAGIISLSRKKILDVGCGNGTVLSYFLKENVPQENLYGIDLLSDRIAEAKRLYRGISFTCGNAARLPYPDEYFEIITQATMFTAILDPTMKKQIALKCCES